ncbi:MAG: rhodanese-like domain-containing protein, partial [Nitrospinota bacterium]
VIEVAEEPAAAAYGEGHIPGAISWFWKEALWHPTDREFPAPAEMAERLGRAGAGPDTALVLYSPRVQFGAYAFWVLQMCGHPDVRLLDGARKKWAAEGRPLTKEVPGFPPVNYPPQRADPSSRIGREGVRAGLGDARRLLLDVRAGDEYRGERVRSAPGPDHGAERAGRIPGAVHLFFRELLNEDDTVKPGGELRAL